VVALGVTRDENLRKRILSDVLVCTSGTIRII